MTVQRKRAEAFVQRAFVNEIAAKAALLVIHRADRAWLTYEEGAIGSDDPRLKDAMRKLHTFARMHPLPPDMEDHL